MLNKKRILHYIISFFCILYIFANYTVQMLGWPASFLSTSLYCFLAFNTLSILTRKTIISQVHLTWYAIFFIICAISMLYAKNFDLSASVCWYLIVAFGMGITMCSYLTISCHGQIFVYSFIFSALFSGVVLVTGFTQVKWWDRLGESFGMNPNIVGLYFVIPFCFALRELTIRNHSILNIAAMCVCAMAVFLTGSKKALLAMIVFPVVFFFCKANSPIKILKIIVILGSAFFVVYYLLLNVPLLYNIMGSRIETMVNTILLGSYENGGGSTAERGDMIQSAIKYWHRSPIFGNGINMFRELYGNETGHYAYAHNNFAELLADVGIVGFCAYYSIYVYFLRRYLSLSRPLRKKNSEYIAWIATLLIFDIASVSYYDMRNIMLISYLIRYKYDDVKTPCSGGGENGKRKKTWA